MFVRRPCLRRLRSELLLKLLRPHHMTNSGRGIVIEVVEAVPPSIYVDTLERSGLGVNTIRRAEADGSQALTAVNAERLVSVLEGLGGDVPGAQRWRALDSVQVARLNDGA